MSDTLNAQVTEMLIGFRAEWADSGAPTYAANIIRAVREAIAAEIEAHVEEAKQRAWDADYEATSTARDTVAFCADLVRRGEQQ